MASGWPRVLSFPCPRGLSEPRSDKKSLLRIVLSRRRPYHVLCSDDRPSPRGLAGPHHRIRDISSGARLLDGVAWDDTELSRKLHIRILVVDGEGLESLSAFLTLELRVDRPVFREKTPTSRTVGEIDILLLHVENPERRTFRHRGSLLDRGARPPVADPLDPKPRVGALDLDGANPDILGGDVVDGLLYGRAQIFIKDLFRHRGSLRKGDAELLEGVNLFPRKEHH